jgi:hypothetical protein
VIKISSPQFANPSSSSLGDFHVEKNLGAKPFEYRPGTTAKIAMWGYGTFLFLNAGGAIALGSKSLAWQAVGRVAAVGCQASAAFTTGLLIGRGLDFLPTYFGKERVSHYLEDGLYFTLGPAPVWAQRIADIF